MKLKYNKMKKNKGFTLVELILTLTVIGTISFLSFQSSNKDFENKQSIALGEQIKNIGSGVNNYIVNHYDVLSTLTNATGSSQDIGPRICDTTKKTCEITIQTLANEGLLPPSYLNKNIYGSGYKIIISRKGSSPYWNISGLITTDTPLIKSGKIRYDLLGLAMHSAGVDSGMTRNSSAKIEGYKGSWSAISSDYSNINKQGLLAYIAGYGSNSYSAFLRRDGTLPMTGDLNMGAKSIYGVSNINASGAITSSTLKSTGTTSVGGILSVSGNSNFSGAVTVNNSLTSTATTTSAILRSTGSTSVGGSLSVSGASNFSGAVSVNNSINSTSTTTSATLKSTGSTFVGGTLSVTGTSNFSGVVSVNNAITSSGNITSSGQIKGVTIVSTGRMSTGEYLQISGTAIKGSSCNSNGLVSRDNTGGLLVCQSLVWKSPASGGGGGFFTVERGASDTYSLLNGRLYSQINTYWTRPCAAVNNKTGACSCPNPDDTLYVSGHVTVSGNSDRESDKYYTTIACSPK